MIVAESFPEGSSDDQILKMIFDRYNHGSVNESERFHNSKNRSLSVNDFVELHDQWYLCESFAWTKVDETFVDAVRSLVCIGMKHGGHPFDVLDSIMFALQKIKII